MPTPEDMTEGLQASVDKAVDKLKQPEMVDSKSDDRTVNNTMRHQYRVLSDVEKEQMEKVKDMGDDFFKYVNSLGSSRNLSLALTKIEEAVMWAVKHITK